MKHDRPIFFRPSSTACALVFFVSFGWLLSVAPGADLIPTGATWQYWDSDISPKANWYVIPRKTDQ